MLKKMATRALLIAGLLLSFVAFPALAQGVARQEYSGLDKYPEQGRPDELLVCRSQGGRVSEIPVGARGIGMGSSFSAVTDDISSMWWNPAGLGFLQQKEVMFNVVDYTMDLTYSYLAAAAPMADGRVVVGGFFGYLDIPDMQITTVGSPAGHGPHFFRL